MKDIKIRTAGISDAQEIPENTLERYPYIVAEEDAYLTKDSVAFHSHLGYNLVGRFHQCGYKFGRWYDMVWMEKILGEHWADPAPVTAFPKIGGV